MTIAHCRICKMSETKIIVQLFKQESFTMNLRNVNEIKKCWNAPWILENKYANKRFYILPMFSTLSLQMFSVMFQAPENLLKLKKFSCSAKLFTTLFESWINFYFRAHWNSFTSFHSIGFVSTKSDNYTLYNFSLRKQVIQLVIRLKLFFFHILFR